MTGINIVFGLIFLIYSYLIFSRVYLYNQFMSLSATLFIAFSYAFVSHFRNVSPYLIPLALCTIIFFRISHKLHNNFKDKVDLIDWFLLLVSVLFHQISIFIMPAILYAQKLSTSKRSSVKIIGSFVVFGIVLISIYVFVYFLTTNNQSLKQFSIWITGYANDDFWVFSQNKGIFPSIQQSVLESLRGHKALIFAPVNRSAVRLYEHMTSHGYDTLFKGISWLLLLSFVVFISFGIKSMIKSDHLKKSGPFLIYWIMPYFIFLQFFTPYQNFYRLFYLLPLMVFLFKGIDYVFIEFKKPIIIISVLCLVSINCVYGIIPENNPGNNPYLKFSNEIQTHSDQNDYFIFSIYPDYHYGVYLRYFGNRDVSFIRTFNPDDHPEVTVEQLEKTILSTIMYLEERYDNIYITLPACSQAGPYFRLSHTHLDQDTPNILLLKNSSIAPDNTYEFGGKKFTSVLLDSN